MAHPELQYLELLQYILDNGYKKELFMTPEVKKQYVDKGEEFPSIISTFGSMMRFDLKKWFPLLTTKKVFIKGIIHELLRLIKWSGNIKYLIDNDVHIWDERAWKKYIEKMKAKGIEDYLDLSDYAQSVKNDDVFAREYADLGSAYPVNRRHFKWEGDRQADQIARVIDCLKNNPNRKSIVVSARHPCYTYDMARPGESMALPPCHVTFQFNVNDKNELSCALFQRSGDMFLGIPFNIASYSLLTMMIAQITGLKLGEFVHFFGDAHIYSNHIDQVKEQITRAPKAFPTMKLNPDVMNIDDFVYSDFMLEGYDPHGPLRAEVFNCGGFEDKKDLSSKVEKFEKEELKN